MKFVVITIFPEMFDPFWDHGIIRRAIDQKKIFATTLNIRDFAVSDNHFLDRLRGFLQPIPKAELTKHSYRVCGKTEAVVGAFEARFDPALGPQRTQA